MNIFRLVTLSLAVAWICSGASACSCVNGDSQDSLGAVCGTIASGAASVAVHMVR